MKSFSIEHFPKEGMPVLEPARMRLPAIEQGLEEDRIGQQAAKERVVTIECDGIVRSHGHHFLIDSLVPQVLVRVSSRSEFVTEEARPGVDGLSQAERREHDFQAYLT